MLIFISFCKPFVNIVVTLCGILNVEICGASTACVGRFVPKLAVGTEHMYFTRQRFGVTVGEKNSSGHYSTAKSVDIAGYQGATGGHCFYCGKSESFIVRRQYSNIGGCIKRCDVGTGTSKHHAFLDSKSFSHADLFLKSDPCTGEYESIIIRKE